MYHTMFALCLCDEYNMCLNVEDLENNSLDKILNIIFGITNQNILIMKTLITAYQHLLI